MPGGRYPASTLALQLSKGIADGVRRDARAALRGRRARRTGDEARGAQLTEFDPLDPRVIADPYPWYRRLLEGERLQYNRRRGIWIISRYEDVRAAGHAHVALSSGEGVIYLRRALPMLLTIDRPEHGRLRRIVARQFTHEALERRRPTIEAIVSAAVDRVVEAGQVDVAAELAMPVPVDVIAELLGIPSSDRHRFREWSDHIVVGFNLAPGNLMRASVSVLPAVFRLRSYFSESFDGRREGTGDDVISHLVRSSEEGQLAAEELFWFALLLLVAGNETTSNLIGTMLLTLATQPEMFDQLRSQPELIQPAVEESLRLHSPVQAFYRTALVPYPLGEAIVPAGGRVLLVFGAGNRDPRHYEQPERFRLERNPTDHLAFGAGIHFCLGAHLARLEARATLRALVDRVERLELAGSPVWTKNPALRGIKQLPLRLIAAK